MPIQFYMDVHVPEAVAFQLRARGVDVLTAIEDNARQLTDAEILQRAHDLGRVVVTQNIRFRALAEAWQKKGRPFSGLVFAHQLRITIGQFVSDLSLIAEVTTPEEWRNTVEHLPL
jgi:predicted nuclease of predicted toxin-antitoxin system